MRFYLALFITLLVSHAAFASNFEAPLGLQTKSVLPAKIVIQKSERVMALLDTQGKVLKTYKIALGKNPIGDKVQQGDNKTPEGIYTIDARNENSKYHLSLRISYPKPAQKARAAQMGLDPGGDIFIHGMPNNKSWMWWKYNTDADWTNGCIALTNQDIKEVWDLVADGTPIIIKP